MDKYKVNDYLSSEYWNFLEDKISKEDIICINGDTGIGKTVFIKDYAIKHNAIIAVPFLSTRNLYAPINIIEKENQNDFYDRKPCVMVYDRLAMMDDNFLAGRTILIDECHILFLDRTYRNNLITLFEKLKKIKSKIVLISASPTGEVEYLGCKNIYRFYKERDKIELMWWRCKYGMNHLEQILKTNEEKKTYDRIVIFSDIECRKLYDRFSVELLDNCSKEVSILHSEYKYTGDLDRITTKELLDTPITLCTSLAFNGLNFKNINEKILVIIDFKIGEDSVSKIIQCIGRVRNSNVSAVVFAHASGNTISVDQKRNIAESFVDVGATHDLFSFNDDLLKNNIYNANKEVEDYLHSQTEETILKSLRQLEYLNITVQPIEENHHEKRYRNPLKDAMSTLLKSQILNETDNKKEKIDKQDIEFPTKTSEQYYDSMNNIFNKVLHKRNLNVGMIKEMLRDENIEVKGKNIRVSPFDKQTLISTIMENLNFVFASIEFERDIESFEDELKKHWKNYDEIEIKRQKTQIDKIKRTIHTYKPIVEKTRNCSLYNLFNGNIGYCKMPVIYAYRQHELEKQIKRITNHSKDKKKKIEIEGKIFDSIDEAAKSCNKDRMTIHRWLKCDKARYVG